MADERKVSAPVKSAGRRKKQTGEEPGAELPAERPAEQPGRKAPGPNGCRRFARARTAEAMPALVQTLIEQSEGGSLGHMRLLVQLSGLDEAVPERRGRSAGVVKALVEEWREAAMKREG